LRETPQGTEEQQKVEEQLLHVDTHVAYRHSPQVTIGELGW
jgi:hypothetical protein